MEGRCLPDFYVVFWRARKTIKRTNHLFHLIIKGLESRVPEAGYLVVDRMRLSSDVLNLRHDLVRSCALAQHDAIQPSTSTGKRKETHVGNDVVRELSSLAKSSRLPRRAVKTHHFFLLCAFSFSVRSITF